MILVPWGRRSLQASTTWTLCDACVDFLRHEMSSVRWDTDKCQASQPHIFDDICILSYVYICVFTFNYVWWCVLVTCTVMQGYVMSCHVMSCHVCVYASYGQFEVLSSDRNLGRGRILSNGTLARGSPQSIHWQVQPSPSKQLACSILCQAVTSGAHPNGEIMFNYIYIL